MNLNETSKSSVFKTKVRSKFWSDLKQFNKDIILPTIYDVYEETGRIASFKHDWIQGSWYTPHMFWDSDVAKWMETASYILGEEKDNEISDKLEYLIDLIEENQEKSGYFNSYFQTVEPDKKWKKITDHELYCIGHLLEASIAYYKYTAKDRFMKLMEKAVEHIYNIFIDKKNAAEFTYPGHEEIELALMKLYKISNNEKHLELTKYFLYQRGRQFENSKSEDYNDTGIQQHSPVELQKEAIGHAVRATYLYCSMIDVAVQTNDEKLWDAVNSLWDDITLRKMFITGGIGTSFSGEAFTYAYDLPNEYGYTETCASIGLIFMAQRFMQVKTDSKYGDVLERALYNTVLGCVSKDGGKFFYCNPLAVDSKLDSYLKILKSHNMQNRERVIPSTERRKDLGCMCCPGNVSRLIASINEYVATITDKKVGIHMPIASEITIPEGKITVDSDYPLKSEFILNFNLNKQLKKQVEIRIPSWCSINEVIINGKQFDFKNSMKSGYMVFKNVSDNTEIIISTAMDVHLNRAHPAVKDAAGKVAIQRGPFVYCLEELDNGEHLYNAYVDGSCDFKQKIDPEVSESVSIIECEGKTISDINNNLYFTDFLYKNRKLTFIPFFARLNRNPGDMIVWINEYKR